MDSADVLDRGRESRRSAHTYLRFIDILNNMPEETKVVTNRLRWVVLGEDEPRLRATWRFLLAVPLLPLVALLLALVMDVLGLAGLIVGGPIQAIVFLIVLGVWARAIDRRPLTDYGVSPTRTWLIDLLAGVSVVVLAHLLWYGLGLAGGWTTIAVSLTAPQDLLVIGIVGTFLSLGLNVWVQDTVYFGIVHRTAAKGFRSRGLASQRAAVGGLLVAVLVFTGLHEVVGPVELVDYLLFGSIMAALYLFTGNLALTTGVHWGVSATAGLLFPVADMVESSPTLFVVTETLPGLLGTVSAHRMPQVAIAFMLLIGWMKWRQGAVSIETSIAQWKPRQQSLTGTTPTPEND